MPIDIIAELYNIYDIWLLTEGVLDLRNGAVFRENPTISLPSMPAEYVIVFSAG